MSVKPLVSWVNYFQGGEGGLEYTSVSRLIRFSFCRILYLLSKLCKFASHNYIAWTAFLKFPFNVKYWKFLHRQNKLYVSQRKRNAWFCLLSFLPAAGLWRLIQETALISGIDWKDTGSATNSHVTLGKSLPPHWVTLFENRGIFVTRPKEYWRSSTGSCFPSPGGALFTLRIEISMVEKA